MVSQSGGRVMGRRLDEVQDPVGIGALRALHRKAEGERVDDLGLGDWLGRGVAGAPDRGRVGPALV